MLVGSVSGLDEILFARYSRWRTRSWWLFTTVEVQLAHQRWFAFGWSVPSQTAGNLST